MPDIPEISTEEVSRELVCQLRGTRSQVALSKRLRFATNVVYAWESGRRYPELSVFFRVAEAAGIPVKERVLGFLEDAPGELRSSSFTSPRAVQRIVTLLVGQLSKLEVAERAGVDRTTIARWLAGKTEPRLPQFLRLIDVTTQRLLEFIGLFVNPIELRATNAAYMALLAQQNLAYDLPFSHAILRALELESYSALRRHQPGFLGQKIGIGLEEEKKYLLALAKAGQIGWSGSHWVVQRVLTVDTRQDPQRNRQLKLHWAKTGLERLAASTSSPDALFSFNLFAISEASFRRIRELHLEYYERVRSIVEESREADRVVLMNLQLIPLERTEGGES